MKLTKGALKFVRSYAAHGDKKRVKKIARSPLLDYEIDLPYLPDGQKGHLYDRYRPKTGANGMALVEIHGGGFIYGFKEINIAHASFYAERGFDAFSINYRLSGKKDPVDAKGQLDDIVAFLHYLEDNEKELGIDVTKLVLTGDSAGGYLALLAALCVNNESVCQKVGVTPFKKAKVLKLVLSSPVYDYEGVFVKAQDMVSKSGIEFMGGGHYGDLPYLKKMNPRTYLHEAEFPPTFVSTCRNDFMKTEAKKLADDLDSIKVENEYYYVDSPDKKVGHVFNILLIPEKVAMDCLEKSLLFLLR